MKPIADYEPWKLTLIAFCAGAALVLALVGLLSLILRH
jgi:hypothetical protein